MMDETQEVATPEEEKTETTEEVAA